MSELTAGETKYLRKKLGRKPSAFELDVVSAEWSEHCSYKSSKKLIRKFPNRSKFVIPGLASDAALLDIGLGYVLAIHIESHNHPSAVEPYGGSATGVGGVIRDILSLGARPIALLNALRFYPLDNANKRYSQSSRWLLRNVTKGIADYGNCIGVPTVGGEVEFDRGFSNYCLVDVAAIGISKREKIIRNRSNKRDIVFLVGGATGRDGIHGSSFASKKLSGEDRSAVQIPDPFTEKLLIEAVLEAVDRGCVNAMKDLGGGGLSCCLSEISETISKGLEVDLSKVHVKEDGMSPSEIILSESQERMLVITSQTNQAYLTEILSKYNLSYSNIGSVIEGKNLVIKYAGDVIMNLPSELICRAPLIDRDTIPPESKSEDRNLYFRERPSDLYKSILKVLANPNIASKKWIYEQFDHEVGIRTVLKPGTADSSVLRLENGKYLAVKLDGNSKQCDLDPYHGTMCILSEVCRNIISTGGKPLAIIDHLQFGSPENAHIFWAFKQSVRAIINYCEFMRLPVVGGKVSFYNENNLGPIKHSPVIGSIGLIDRSEWIMMPRFGSEESIFIIGNTKDEMGGSEFYETTGRAGNGKVPIVDLNDDMRNAKAVLRLIREDVVSSLHDCSKGGLAITLCEMAMRGGNNFQVDLDKIPNSCSSISNLLFSETPSRYILSTNKRKRLNTMLSAISGLEFSEIGMTTNNGSESFLHHSKLNSPVILTQKNITDSYENLGTIMERTPVD
ncbi:MAG TPA: phosphoribosylformylglycinamidine synthase subunit PurL [Nitrososphaeraceae archaeon]|jgi:phosphoribosylformylglycinamidine synthase